MLVTCPKCTEGIADGQPCSYCGETGKVDLTDVVFRDFAESDFRAICGIIWDLMLRKMDALDVKMDTLDSHLAAIEVKIEDLEP